MPAWLNWVSSQWMSTQFEGGSNSIPPVKFDWALITGWIGWKFIEITLYASLIKLGIISVDLHPIWPVKFLYKYPVEFDRALITGQIGWKFIEITLYPCLVKLGISVNSTGIYLNGFTPNLTGQIWPGINYWLNWVEIHWDYIVCLPGWMYACLVKFGGHNLNEFTPNLTSRIQVGINYWSNWVEIHWDYIVCLPGWTGYLSEFDRHLFSMDLHPIRLVKFDRALITSWIG